MTNINQVNAQFSNLSGTEESNWITGESTAIISTVDADGDYTPNRRIVLSELGTLHGAFAYDGDFDTFPHEEFEKFRDEVVVELDDIAAEIAAAAGLRLTDGGAADGQIFWNLAAK